MSSDRKLIALDIDGTIMFEDELIPAEVKREVKRLVGEGHEVMLATGRGAPITLPVAEALDITPEYIVCANGAVILHRDESDPSGYRKYFVETFDPKELLLELRKLVPDANYAVEDMDGFLRYTTGFDARGLENEQVPFERLLDLQATRVMIVSADHTSDEFSEMVAALGMHRASYAVGWTAWLDITPYGVNKATALERVRHKLGISRDNVAAIGDGRNDIEMLEWAGEFGRGAAMGSAPDEVKAVASEVVDTLARGGSTHFLESL